MATAPANNLPLFYKDLQPLSSVDHADWRARGLDRADFLIDQHAVPLTSDEFTSACRFYPIVFSAGDNPVPLALMGLNEGVHPFADAAARLKTPVYAPAYIRRYPFLPVTTPGNDALMLAIDRPRLVERGGAVPEDEPGRLFDGDKASPLAERALAFCERYHRDHLRTAAFAAALRERDLLDARRADIRLPDRSQFRVDGFRMIDRVKLRVLPDDCLGDWFRKGWLDLAALAEAAQANWQALLDRKAALPSTTTDAPPARRRPARKRADA